MTQVLVTGASGFIGGHLVAELVRRGANVRCLMRATSSPKHLPVDSIECVTGDLLDESALERAVANCETVYHVGGAISVLKSEQFARVNVDGTASLVRACERQERPPLFLLVSSISACGPTKLGHVRTEAEPPQPMSIYGRSKRGGEEVAEAAAGRMPVTVVRPGIVFGPRDRELFASMQAIWKSYLHFMPRRRNPPLSFIEVTDLVALIIAAAERGRRVAPPGAGPPGTGDGYYFATCDEFPTYRQFGQIAARAMGRPFAVPLVPPRPIPWTMALVNEGIARLRRKPAMFCRDKFYEAIVESWACSNQTAREQLGFAPSAPFADQIKATIAWYREHGWL